MEADLPQESSELATLPSDVLGVIFSHARIDYWDLARFVQFHQHRFEYSVLLGESFTLGSSPFVVKLLIQYFL